MRGRMRTWVAQGTRTAHRPLIGEWASTVLHWAGCYPKQKSAAYRGASGKKYDVGLTKRWGSGFGEETSQKHLCRMVPNNFFLQHPTGSCSPSAALEADGKGPD